MTDKEQIIIDGCNVLKCRYYQYKTLKDCEMRYPESGDCEIGLINYLFNGNLDMEKLCVDNPNCYFKQLARKTQECEQKDKEINKLHLIIDRLLEASGYDKNISSAEDFEDVYADIDYKLGLLDELKQECQELKKANLHIDTNRQCKGSKLKRIEELISACEAGYTDEFIQKIYGIIQESEPAIDDYSIIDRYRKALDEIEKYCNNVLSFTAVRTTESDILDIINKAKGGEDE